MVVKKLISQKKDVKKTSNPLYSETPPIKRKYIKSGNYTKEEILKRKMERVFDKSKK